MRYVLIIALAGLLGGASPAPAPSPDPAAVAAVSQYVDALSRGDDARAFALQTSGQQRYFGSVNNFASNALSTKYAIHRFKIVSALSHGQIVEVVVRQETSFLNAATGRMADGAVREPYFALRENGAWRIKQLYQPWKSYAPNVSGQTQGVSVVVHRIEFYDKRIQVDCTIRNDSHTAVQVLPLGKSVLDDGATKVRAINEAAFPPNDLGFFEGARLKPGTAMPGFMNFPVTQKKDEAQTLTLTVAPAIFDAAERTLSIVVGPMHLDKL